MHRLICIQAIQAQASMDYLEGPGPLNQKNSMMAKLLNNLALCYAKKEDWPSVREHSQQALDLRTDRASMTKVSGGV